MADSFSLPGIDLPSPTLSARLREMADFLSAPASGRLTEEQRALSLGIARRLVADAAAELDAGIDVTTLWNDWFAVGLPGAARLAGACFARAEEHRWRDASAQRVTTPAAVEIGDDHEQAIADAARPERDDPPSARDEAYLALQIADRRRFDPYGNPCLLIADIDDGLLRAILLDIAAWRLTRTGKDGAIAANLHERVQHALAHRKQMSGIDDAAAAYHRLLAKASALADGAAMAIARHDWLALTALTAAANRRAYADTALALVTAEAAALPILLAPLRIERAALAPLEASLAMLPARAMASATAADDYAAPSFPDDGTRDD